MVRKYGLFEVTMNGKRKSYSRLFESLAFPKSQAVRVFQNALLLPILGGNDASGTPLKPRELRPVK